MGVYIPNMDKPKSCAECFRILKCKAVPRWVTADDSIPKGCPLIDIVQCKDCKNSHMTYDGKCKYCDLVLDDDDNYIECYFDGDHFCSYGERRSDGNKRRSV